eukprot:COSAG04_NODE_453_length_14110_cov_262.397473_11_plen_223_part_00
MWTPCGEFNGFPTYRTVEGGAGRPCLHWLQATGGWHLISEYTEDKANAGNRHAAIAAPSGATPLGENTWTCFVGGRDRDRQLTLTAKDTWRILAKHGFDERVGGDSNGGLYGKGIYLADVSSKANQCSADSTAPICNAPLNADGHHCMLLCRATMGSPFMAKKRLQGIHRPPDNPATRGLPYDSVFAKEGFTTNFNGKQFHNEYVIFNGAQIYPEYVVWYTL